MQGSNFSNSPQSDKQKNQLQIQSQQQQQVQQISKAQKYHPSIILQNQQNQEIIQSQKRGSVIEITKKALIKTQSKKSYKQIIEQLPYLYFQKQSAFSSQCLKHALNHLFGYSLYSSKDLVNFCNELSKDFINPHKHVFGGDYDVNVLMLALQSMHRSVQWFDKRKKFKFSQQQQNKLEGYLLNIKKQSKFMQKVLGLSGRHWITIKWVNNAYYIQYDSQKQGPSLISNYQNQQLRINNCLKNGGQLFKVYKLKNQEKKQKTQEQQQDQQFISHICE